MKVLMLHNYHRTGSASGDDQVFDNEAELLQEHGVRVIKYSVSNDEYDKAGVFGKIAITMGMLWSFKHSNAVKTIIKNETPDIVHVHTFFPLLSPSVLYAAKRNGCKVVATLHDARFICPCATSLRGNTICNLCGDGKYFRMCRYRCFKDSLPMSFVVACIFRYHRWRKSFYNQIDRYICLNDTQVDLLTGIGFSKDKLIKKYNFTRDMKKNISELPGDSKKGITLEQDLDNREREVPDRYVIFFGRIGKEKGADLLMKMWDKIDDIPLVIIGGGPLEEEIKEWAARREHVYYLGYRRHDECLSIVQKAEYVVFPSIWYEGCSMVEVESEMMGKPIIASDIGFSHELINDGVNGYLVPLGDLEGFVRRIKEMWNDKETIERMSAAARKDYENRFERENNYRQLKCIYDALISSKQSI